MFKLVKVIQVKPSKRSLQKAKHFFTFATFPYSSGFLIRMIDHPVNSIFIGERTIIRSKEHVFQWHGDIPVC